MVETVDTLAAKIDSLRKSVDQRFEQVDQRFEQVDQRFEQVDQQFIELKQQMAADATETRRIFAGQIVAEGERTRRHFDIVAEQMKAERNLALDKSISTAEQLAGFVAANAADHAAIERRLDNHEQRVTRLESK